MGPVSVQWPREKEINEVEMVRNHFQTNGKLSGGLSSGGLSSNTIRSFRRNSRH